jgi:LDH2 family malate/lactate/ureidoglycolate dehydrogenase
MNWKGFGICGLIEILSQNLSGGTEETSVRTISAVAEILTKYLSNISQGNM